MPLGEEYVRGLVRRREAGRRQRGAALLRRPGGAQELLQVFIRETRKADFGGHKDDKELKELTVPERLKWVPEAVRKEGRAYDVGQMWVNFSKAIRAGQGVEPDFDHAVRRHRMLDAIVRASETGQRQKVIL